MGKRLPYTPRSRVRSALRMLFLRSRERAKAMKEQKYTCQRCGVKQSVAKGREVKVECHHRAGVLNWDEIIDSVYKDLLCDSTRLEVLCKSCHKIEGDK